MIVGKWHFKVIDEGDVIVKLWQGDEQLDELKIILKNKKNYWKMKRRRMILIFKIMGILMVSLVCYGQQKITDVPATDAAYPAIKRSVEKGYFTLMDGNKFLPDQGESKRVGPFIGPIGRINKKGIIVSR